MDLYYTAGFGYASERVFTKTIAEGRAIIATHCQNLMNRTWVPLSGLKVQETSEVNKVL